MTCQGQAPLHQHADGTIQALAGDGETTFTVVLGDVAQCSCPAGASGQRCFHIVSAAACFASFFTAPWAAGEQSENLFEQIRGRLTIVANTLPEMSSTSTSASTSASSTSICTENPPCVRLQMTPTIAAVLASMNEPRQHSRQAA